MDWRDALIYAVPTIVLVFLLAWMWGVTVWVRDHVVRPVVDAHLGLIDILRERLPEQTSSALEQVKANAAKLDALTASLDLGLERQAEIREAIDRQTDLLRTTGKASDP